jgi:hypothetical protein
VDTYSFCYYCNPLCTSIVTSKTRLYSSAANECAHRPARRWIRPSGWCWCAVAKQSLQRTVADGALRSAGARGGPCMHVACLCPIRCRIDGDPGACGCADPHSPCCCCCWAVVRARSVWWGRTWRCVVPDMMHGTTTGAFVDRAPRRLLCGIVPCMHTISLHALTTATTTRPGPSLVYKRKPPPRCSTLLLKERKKTNGTGC